MGKIHVLSEHVVSHISAGEVVERPCYAVKELIENAIDAHADSISIEIEESGLKRIIVTDNGEGMMREDVELCFKPHTTSKIQTEDDLIGIRTYGFRGEALSSVASVSTMEIKSRYKSAFSGTSIEVQQGKIQSVSSVGMPVGTRITIEQLFSQVPARKKFLKSLQTEFRHITEVVIKQALAHKEIRFRLTHNGRSIFDLPPTPNIQERIAMLLGPSVANNLIPVSSEDSYICVAGFISRPQLVTRTSQKNYIVVNGRPIVDKAIASVIREAYGTLLERHTFPIFLVFLTIPYERVDVNIHPRKEQVSFVDPQFVYDSIRKLIKDSLTGHNLMYHAEFRQQSFTELILRDAVSPWQVKETDYSGEVLQIHNVYLAIPTKNGVLFIDQHAAHERILFEQFKDAFEQKRLFQERYKLSQTVMFDLSYTEAQLLIEHGSLFDQLGFILEHFKDNTFIVREVPNILKDRDSQKFILEILENIMEDKSLKNPDAYSDRILKYLACRTAIKAGEPLTQEESKKLIKKLEKTQNNSTCPHGRPTRIEISLKNFHTFFKR